MREGRSANVTRKDNSLTDAESNSPEMMIELFCRRPVKSAGGLRHDHTTMNSHPLFALVIDFDRSDQKSDLHFIRTAYFPSLLGDDSCI
ncbi:MAG: hypothetical protein FJ404_03335 [Verrucomicrobia bacterium]|nr:hypothetical protein [Verrucomicrobiota bacterium]